MSADLTQNKQETFAYVIPKSSEESSPHKSVRFLLEDSFGMTNVNRT